MDVVHEHDRAGSQARGHVSHDRAHGRLRLVVAGQHRPEHVDETEGRGRRVEARVVLLVRSAEQLRCVTEHLRERVLRARELEPGEPARQPGEVGVRPRVVADDADCLLVADDIGPVLQPVADDEERRSGACAAKDRHQAARVLARPVVEGERDRVRAPAAAVDGPTAVDSKGQSAAQLGRKRYVRPTVRLRPGPRGEAQRYGDERHRQHEDETHERSFTCGRATRARSRRTASRPRRRRAHGPPAHPGTTPRAPATRRR